MSALNKVHAGQKLVVPAAACFSAGGGATDGYSHRPEYAGD